jgi:hypothetical protein
MIMKTRKALIAITLGLVILGIIYYWKVNSHKNISSKFIIKNQNNKIISEVVSPSEKKVLVEISQQFNKLAQETAYQRNYLDQVLISKECFKLAQLYNSTINLSISSEREKITDRIFDLGITYCGSSDTFYRNLNKGSLEVTYTRKDWKYIAQKLKNSAALMRLLASLEVDQHEQLNILIKAIDIDPHDLHTFRNILGTDQAPRKLATEERNLYQKEYCKKAVELRQWDHIYYLTNNQELGCLYEGEKFPNQCKCPEAMKLVAPYWPEVYKNQLVDPTGDIGSEKYYQAEMNKLNRFISKLPKYKD